MLTGLGLRNFKAFGDEMQHAPLAPITLIYGPNSGGKSSVMQALLLLKQSQEAVQLRNDAMQLIPAGPYADLGSVESLIHNHGTHRTFEIYVSHKGMRKHNVPMYALSYRRRFRTPMMTQGRVKMSFKGIQSSLRDAGIVSYRLSEVQYDSENADGTDYQVRLSRAIDKDEFGNELEGLSIFNWADDRSIDSYARYTHQQLNDPDISQAWRKPRKASGTTEASSLRATKKYLHKSYLVPEFGLPNNIMTTDQSTPRRSLPAIFKFPYLFDVMDDPGRLREHLGTLSHLGPLRKRPERSYRIQGQTPNTVGNSGENTPDILRNDEGVVESTNRRFEAFNIPYELKVSEIGNIIHGAQISVLLVDKRSNTEVTLADVGFGINQFLPVIVEGVISRGKTICVEQPEIHLHPRLQANIADLLIDTSSAKRGEDGNQWLVETHSEMIIRRIQRRIRERVISSDDVSVLYVDPQDDGSSSIQQLRLDENGYWLDDWPDGFFDEGYREIMDY